MKRNHCLLLAALLVTGITLTHLPNASAQPQAGGNQEKTEKDDVQARLADAIKAVHADAVVGASKKAKTIGTNDLYSVEFTSKGKKISADVTADGTLVKTDEAADIKSFPTPARDALIKAVTAVGMRENGLRITHTYATVNSDGVASKQSSATIYGADVANNRGERGRLGFSEDGSLVEHPAWMK